MKKTLAFFIAIVAVGTFTMPLMAETETVNGYTWTYRIHGNTAEIGDGRSVAISPNPTGAITLPASLGGKTVTKIGFYAFMHCTNLTSVTIPNSIVDIGGSTFDSCSGLKAFNVSEGNPKYKSISGLLLTKDEKTLVCGVNGNMTIPESVTNIADFAFYGCCRRDAFHVENGNPSYKSVSGLLLSKDGKTLVCGVNGNVVIPDGVTIIGSNAFRDCGGLLSVTIPTSTTNIMRWAFLGCDGLTSITIPENVTGIGQYAFADCSKLNTFHVADGNPSYKSVSGLLLSKDGKTLVYGVNGNVVIPDGVTSIGDAAFSSRSGLMSVMIPNTVTSIGSDAFYGCTNLTNMSIPDSVTSVGESAFAGCSDSIFNTTTIPGVKLVDGWAVGNTGKLSGALNLTGIRGIGNGAFFGCKGLTSVTIPDSVASIGNGAFSGCKGLTSVTIPDSMISTWSYTFSGCSKLESVTISSSVTNIVANTFARSPRRSLRCGLLGRSPKLPCLKSFSVGTNNSSYSSRNGMLCTKDGTTLIAGVNGDVKIPSCVTRIGDAAFKVCGELTSVTIPASVTNIGAHVFYGCNELAAVTMLGECPTSQNDIFKGCGKLKAIHIPANAKSWEGMKDWMGIPLVIGGEDDARRRAQEEEKARREAESSGRKSPFLGALGVRRRARQAQREAEKARREAEKAKLEAERQKQREAEKAQREAERASLLKELEAIKKELRKAQENQKAE